MDDAHCPSISELHPLNQTFYYKNPSMPSKANFGTDEMAAVTLAHAQNAKYRIELEQKAFRLEATLDLRSPKFGAALQDFVGKYVRDYRLKSSTARRLLQRQQRLVDHLGGVQVAAVDTQMLRESNPPLASSNKPRPRRYCCGFFNTRSRRASIRPIWSIRRMIFS
jgi:hypothetical protein